jgi:hypothetical protein
MRFSVGGNAVRAHHCHAAGYQSVQSISASAGITPIAIGSNKKGSAKIADVVLVALTAAPLIHAIAALGCRIVPPHRAQNRAVG